MHTPIPICQAVITAASVAALFQTEFAERLVIPQLAHMEPPRWVWGCHLADHDSHPPFFPCFSSLRLGLCTCNAKLYDRITGRTVILIGFFILSLLGRYYHGYSCLPWKGKAGILIRPAVFN